MATLIGRKFHVSYSASGATRLMHRLAFTPQVPTRRAAERDERAMAAWREATWTEVKAPGRPATDGSVSRTKPGSPAGRARVACGAARHHPGREGLRPGQRGGLEGSGEGDGAPDGPERHPPPRPIRWCGESPTMRRGCRQ
ncbi:winged helix-turn-helix domain-containing protein [Streptomyces virginiae]|uniref:winged helix-turn-helix domain-containing protein n=1 Tax=Streptomyces virginiae TaxID=1961 RepID=UPI0036E64618